MYCTDRLFFLISSVICEMELHVCGRSTVPLQVCEDPAPHPQIPSFAFPWRVQGAPFRFAKSEALQMTELCPQPQHSDYSLGELLNKALPPFFGCFNGILRNISLCPQGGNLPFFSEIRIRNLRFGFRFSS